MQNNELETIAAAMQEALHRAYALGRSDALRRVVELVQSDELGSKTVALLSHSEPAVVEAPTAEFESSAPSHELPGHDVIHAGSDAAYKDGAFKDGPAHSDGPHNDNASTAPHAQEAGKPPASMKDFLLDYLYPLGAKK